MKWNIAESTVAEPEQRIARRHLLLAGSVNCVREIPLPTNASRNRSCGQMIVNLRNRQPQLRFTALFARALRFGRAEFCSLTAPRCADSTDCNGQDLTWQSRSVFDTLGRGRVAGVGAQRNPGVVRCGTSIVPGLPSLRFVQPRPPRRRGHEIREGISAAHVAEGISQSASAARAFHQHGLPLNKSMDRDRGCRPRGGNGSRSLREPGWFDRSRVCRSLA